MVYSRGFGYAETADAELADPLHRWRFASVSKPVCAVAALRALEDSSAWSLGSTAFGPGALFSNDYGDLTNFPYTTNEKAITLRQLMNMTAGWADEGKLWYNAEPGWGTNHSLIIDYHLDSRNTAWTPGTHYRYNNFNYQVAAHGLGWYAGTRNGHTWWQHNGAMGGTQAILVVRDDGEQSFAYATNSVNDDDKGSGAFRNLILDQMNLIDVGNAWPQTDLFRIWNPAYDAWALGEFSSTVTSRLGTLIRRSSSRAPRCRPASCGWNSKRREQVFSAKGKPFHCHEAGRPESRSGDGTGETGRGLRNADPLQSLSFARMLSHGISAMLTSRAVPTTSGASPRDENHDPPRALPLASTWTDSICVLDDLAARSCAEVFQLQVIGTLGILL